MGEERTLESWAPHPRTPHELAEIVDLAFDYRGDVTIIRTDGRRLAGYVYNRDRDAPEPFLQLYDAAGTSHALRYAEVATIHFTGPDMAAGKSYEAWLERKAGQRP